MHGKILRYSTQTKNGVVTNASKKIFELRGNSWHDPKMMPSVGMLVEFRCDDNGYTIVDCRASSYQSFPEGGLLREIDFWRTNTDEELKAKEADAKANIAKQIFAKTNYVKLNKIELSASAQECIKDFFRDEFNAIAFLDHLQQDSTPVYGTTLNYLIIKPFLTKAIDFLVYNDRHITMDNFASELQTLKQLEYSYNHFKTNVNINASKIYKECFLDAQYHYKGVLRAIEVFNEKKLQIENKVRVCGMVLRSIQAKVDAKKGDPKVLEAKKVEIGQIVAKAKNDTKNIQMLIDKLKNMSEAFVKDNFTTFEVVFGKIYQLLVDKTNEALNICGTKLDDKVWSLGMGSQAIKNVFFRQHINSPFCAMTFVENHIKHLNKAKMSNNESAIYSYAQRYGKSYKNYVIFCENEAFELDLKVKILALAKNNYVYVFQKEIEFFTAVNKMKFEICFIDSELRLSNPKEILKAGVSSKRNKDTKFMLLKASDIKNLTLQTPSP